ncbi:GH25 family lysozyme [Bacillus thuringiensis]|uniref:GH25 family lysozyme n=1 Tax=Bacillus thuringiensis TaxID=1428 RepID=UPI002FBEE90A
MKKIADISYYNGTINWAEASKELELAIIRVQYGSNKIDPKYKEYVKGCKTYDVPFGHYAYGCYTSVQDAIVEANDFMARADKDAKFLVLDVEDDTLANCGATNLAKATQAFIDTCRSAGWKVGLYVSHHMYPSYGLNSVNADFLWIPRYGGNKPAYSCDIWQYTEQGRVAGITGNSGNVDLNYIVGNKSLEWFIGKEGNSEDSTWTNANNPIDGSIGVCWNKYGEGAGVNIYSEPRRSDETYKGTISDTVKYRVYGEVNGFYGIGLNTYIQTDYVNFTPYVAVVTPVGGVNTYKGAIRSENNYMQTLGPGTKWLVLAYRDGWFMVGNDEWIPSEYVMIKY